MFGFYPTYVSVAEKKARAQKAIEKLTKSGLKCSAIDAFRGNIAKTFWGKSWCENLESYRDFAYRLERGRSYVRHGCVCHLEINSGVVRAYVSGSSIYSVTIKIDPLSADRWLSVCEQCAGRIGSLMELLQGKFSSEVMSVVSKPRTGIFPDPKEIHLSCSCPDSAKMCKHVSAVL